jgi:choline-sulfatase
MNNDAPNILIIQADQLSAQALPAYGNRIAQTPHIDRLADEGTVFENAYCNYPLCAPSRFSMMTGQLPSRIDAFDNGSELPAGIPTFAHFMRLAGYQCSLAGKMHFMGPDMLHGFDQRLTPELYQVDFRWTENGSDFSAPKGPARGYVTDDIRLLIDAGVCVRSASRDYDDNVAFRAETELHRMARNPDQGPFLLVASFTHPHEPYYTTQADWDRYRHDDIDLPHIPMLDWDQHDTLSQRSLALCGLEDNPLTDDQIRVARHAYFANTSYLDDQVGRLLNTLTTTGLADNTVVILTADHGDMLGERGLWFKSVFFERAMRVPLIICAPGRNGARRVGVNVSLVDLLPTLVDFSAKAEQLEQPEALDGNSLFALLDNDDSDWPDTVFTEMATEKLPAFMVRQGNFKYVTLGDDTPLLFDLISDPHELENRSGHAEFADIERELAVLTTRRWNSAQLAKRMLESQRRRIFVQSAHEIGRAPEWDTDPADADRVSCYREGNYVDWAFQWTKLK